MVGAFFMSGEICFFYAHFYGRRYRPLLTELWVLLSRLAILAIFPERGQKVPPLSLFGGEKRPTYNKQRVQGKSPLLEQRLDGGFIHGEWSLFYFALYNGTSVG